MEKYKIAANEEFFFKTINQLKEGGVYGWISEQEIFTKRNGKLNGSDLALKKVSRIVSQFFFEKYFAKTD